MTKSRARASNPDQVFWARRLVSLGRAQSRYLWVLLVLGVFFLSLVVPSSDSDPPIPWLGIILDPKILLGAAPGVLYVLIIVVIGALRAYGDAKSELGLGPSSNEPPTETDVKRSEAYDEVPNALDLAVYTRKRFEKSPAVLLLLNYPLYLTLFLVEGGYLWIRFILSISDFRGWNVAVWILLSLLDVALGLAAAILVLFLWYRRLSLMLRIFSSK